jgi:chromosome segregation ATPase
MLVENIMYFALGLLVAGLIGLIIMPAVWQRAVRLTKKRIEAATPITMAEFRADKDQLRAEFALSTRRLEMNVEALRRRLADQLRDINRRKTEVGSMKGERDSHLTIVRELEEREAELRRRILELEKDGADIAQKLRMRDREYAEKVTQLEAARESMRGNTPKSFAFDGKALSGDYNADIDELLQMLEIERKRSTFLETQNRTLIGQLESSDQRSASATAAAAEMRASLAKRDDAAEAVSSELIEAEARIADAESRVNEILAETAKVVDTGEQQRGQLLAEKLSLEEELESLRVKVETVEMTVMADWDSDRIEQSHLREKLNDIATDVSRLVYAVEGHGLPDSEESLFDRVQRYADDGLKVEEFPVRAALQSKQSAAASAANTNGNNVSDRLTALREIQDRN